MSDQQEVALLLHECLRRALSGPEETACALPKHSDLFPDDLSSLLQEAADRKWPFVEEKWQYKQSVTSEDKINSSDLIRRHLPQLLLFLRDSIAAVEVKWAVAVIFLVDRLLYWMDSSHVLLKIAKALHKRYPEIPIAPQVIIRQARVYLNSGKLQKAEFILSSLINNNGLSGSWTYEKISDQTLVQAVSLQIRGQVLQKLGLWIDAFELIWASLVGFYALPQPDKKGIGTSLGILANLLISMNDNDFDALQKKPHINFSLLGEARHRVLSAARAAQIAVVYSQYTSLYVLTNVVAQGSCLLSYSFSERCSRDEQKHYLTLAKEAFEIGLLTHASENVVTSKQELYTLLKASYCLSITHRWMTGASENVTTAMKSCQEGMTLLSEYSTKSDATLCTEITKKIQLIKSLLSVKGFINSDPRSFIPDSYRSVEFGHVPFVLDEFNKMRDGFKKHHRSVCETFEINAPRKRTDDDNATRFITAFQIDTETTTEDHSRLKPSNPRLEITRESDQEDSRRNFRQNSSSSGSSFILVDPSCCTETCDEEQIGVSHHESVAPSTSNPRQDLCTTVDEENLIVTDHLNVLRDSEKSKSSGSFSSSLDLSSYEHVPLQNQSSIETVEDILDPSQFGGDVTSRSINRPDSSYSLGDSFGSRSSWEKLSVSPVKPRTSTSSHKHSASLSTTESDPFEDLGFEHLSIPEIHETKNPSEDSRHDCFKKCVMGSDVLTERDYRCLFAGVCHSCLMKRLPNKPMKALEKRELNTSYNAVVLKFSKASDLWMGFESSVFIGERTGDCGTQRRAVNVQYLHQEQLLSSYVGKEYLQEKGLHAHLDDVERQMTAQYYVNEFNKRLYDNNITTQIFFIPSEVLLVLEKDRIKTCLSAEPYMSGDFIKLTNNTKRTKTEHEATKFGIAFGHFTYEFSNHEEVVVDLQGWVSSNGKGLTYLTDPQIHSLTKLTSSNFKQTGINNFLKYQHGDECNEICHAAGLKKIT